MRFPQLGFPGVAMVALLCGACASDNGWSYPSGTPYDYDWQAAWGGTWENYFWNRTPFEGYTIVHTPAYVGERWEDLTLRAQARRDRDPAPNATSMGGTPRSRQTTSSRVQSSSCDAGRDPAPTPHTSEPATSETRRWASHSAPRQAGGACRAVCPWCLR